MLSCAICVDRLLAAEPACSTRCGHIFHEQCLSRWMSSNHTCPQCRQTSDRNSIHRVYLPYHQFDNNDLLEKLNEISVQKKDQESVIKNLEGQKRKLEYELKVKKKQYHKVLQRQKFEKHGKGTNIPRAKHPPLAGPSTSASSSSSLSTAVTNSSSNEKTRPSPSNASRQKRNLNRILRSKEYFRQKRAAHRGAINNNNNNNNNNNDNNNNPSADRPPRPPVLSHFNE